jgi:Fe-S-cluster containining protein
MPIEWTDADELIDPKVSCGSCDAVCCRLTVLIMPEDKVPRGLTAIDDHGLEMMARGEDGWCVALDPLRMCCSIYELRPDACRRFTMGAGYCRDERKAYSQRYPGSIPVTLIDS